MKNLLGQRWITSWGARTEVRSKMMDSQLKHIFDNGPKEKGGLRYCINLAVLRFVGIDEMAQQGYGEYVDYVSG